jgi:hypothetical protein
VAVTTNASPEEEFTGVDRPVGQVARAQRLSRTIEMQATGIIWGGVLASVLGVLALIATNDKLIAGLLTFGGAAIVFGGLIRGAYAHYLYWRMATDD